MSVKTIPVNEYADMLLRDRESLSSDEVQINGDFDYVMLLMLVMEYDSSESPYHIDFGEGMVKIGGYGIPNMIISRK